jgi:hypothetical protein
MRCLCEVHVYEAHAHEVYAREVHTHEVQAREMHAHEVRACEIHVYEVLTMRLLPRDSTNLPNFTLLSLTSTLLRSSYLFHAPSH